MTLYKLPLALLVLCASSLPLACSSSSDAPLSPNSGGTARASGGGSATSDAGGANCGASDASPTAQARGKYLTGLHGCVNCHTPKVNGMLDMANLFGGADCTADAVYLG